MKAASGISRSYKNVRASGAVASSFGANRGKFVGREVGVKAPVPIPMVAATVASGARSAVECDGHFSSSASHIVGGASARARAGPVQKAVVSHKNSHNEPERKPRL